MSVATVCVCGHGSSTEGVVFRGVAEPPRWSPTATEVATEEGSTWIEGVAFATLVAKDPSTLGAPAVRLELESEWKALGMPMVALHGDLEQSAQALEQPLLRAVAARDHARASRDEVAEADEQLRVWDALHSASAAFDVAALDALTREIWARVPASYLNLLTDSVSDGIPWRQLPSSVASLRADVQRVIPLVYGDLLRAFAREHLDASLLVPYRTRWLKLAK